MIRLLLLPGLLRRTNAVARARRLLRRREGEEWGVKRLLIVATVPFGEAELRSAAPDLWRAEAPLVKIVAPASDLSFGKWLANDEDGARTEAEDNALEVAGAVPVRAPETEVGDADPLRAVEDALRTFRADELIVALPPEAEASWLERRSAGEGFERFDLPVRYVVASGVRA